MRLACAVLLGFSLAVNSIAAAWTSVKADSFLVISEGSAREAREVAAGLEQFRFSLGELLGRRDLAVRPQLEFLLTTGVPAGMQSHPSRTGALVLVQAPGPLSAQSRKELARILLRQSVGRLPEHLEHGLDIFLSTTEVHGARVTWGALPPPDERDADWSLVHYLVTNPETYGNVRVLLTNLENQVAEDVAFRNSIHRSREQIAEEARAAQQAGQLPTIDAPSRPLNPDHDLPAHTMEANEVTLRLADLLDNQSERRYRSLIESGAYRMEATEGLALLAAQRGDVQTAAESLRQALAAGSKNATVMIAYAKIEPNPEKARAMLEKAVAADPHSAEAHYLLAEKLDDGPKRIEEYGTAAKLNPRNQQYWMTLAQLLEKEKQWAAAAKAWRSAEAAAATPEERETMLRSRLLIDEKRLDYEDEQKRLAKEAEQRELDRLKQQAVAEIRAAEIKNNNNRAPKDAADAVPWEQMEGAAAKTERTQATLIRVDCQGDSMHLVLRTKSGRLIKLTGARANFAAVSCGPQKARVVVVGYTAAGELKQIEDR